MKKSLISIVASTAIAGLVLTGCGSSGGGSTGGGSTGVGTNPNVQASNVNFVEIGGLTVLQDGAECTNDENITSGTDNKLIVTPDSLLDGCTIDLTKEHNLSVNPSLAYFDLNASQKANPSFINDKNKLNKKFTETLKGVKDKNVNIFSTIAIANGESVEDIDANSDSVAGIKNLIQAALKVGTKLDEIRSDVNITEIVKLDKGTSSENNLTKLIPIKIGDKLGIDLNEIDVNSSKTIEVEVDENGTVKLISDSNDTQKKLDKANEKLKIAAVTPSLTVSNIGLEFGGKTYRGSDNNFTITRTPAEFDANEDIKISLTAVADNNYTLSNAKFIAKISTTNENVVLKIDGINITSGESGKVSTTIVKDANVSLTASNGTGIDGVTGKIDNNITSSDLSFSIDKLIPSITANAGAAETVKNQLLNHINRPGTYNLQVGLEGNQTVTDYNTTVLDNNETNATTNFKDVNITVDGSNTQTRGFFGKIIIKELTAEQQAAKDAVATNIASIETFENAEYENSFDDKNATTIQTQVNTVNAEIEKAKTAAQAVLDSKWSTSKEKADAETLLQELDAQTQIKNAISEKITEIFTTATSDINATLDSNRTFANSSTLPTYAGLNINWDSNNTAVSFNGSTLNYSGENNITINLTGKLELLDQNTTQNFGDINVTGTPTTGGENTGGSEGSGSDEGTAGDDV